MPETRGGSAEPEKKIYQRTAMPSRGRIRENKAKCKKEKQRKAGDGNTDNSKRQTI